MTTKENTMNGMLNKATTRVHGVLDQAVDAVAPAAQWLEERGEALTARSEKLLDRARQYGAANPRPAPRRPRREAAGPRPQVRRRHPPASARTRAGHRLPDQSHQPVKRDSQS